MLRTFTLVTIFHHCNVKCGSKNLLSDAYMQIHCRNTGVYQGLELSLHNILWIIRSQIILLPNRQMFIRMYIKNVHGTYRHRKNNIQITSTKQIVKGIQFMKFLLLYFELLFLYSATHSHSSRKVEIVLA